MLNSDFDLESLSKRVVFLYNRTHIPNSKATLIGLSSPYLIIEFTGVICTACSTFEISDGFREQYKLLANGKSHLKLIKETPINPRTLQATFQIIELDKT